jgi:hypothetical protein
MIKNSRIERFSLHILEPGEIYFEDYLVNYHVNNSPLSKQPQQQSNKIQEIQKGNLKIFSKSYVLTTLQ